LPADQQGEVTDFDINLTEQGITTSATVKQTDQETTATVDQLTQQEKEGIAIDQAKEIDQAIAQANREISGQRRTQESNLSIDDSRAIDQQAADFNRRISGQRRSSLNNVISRFDQQLAEQGLTTDQQISRSDINISENNSVSLDQDVEITSQENFRFEEDSIQRDIVEFADQAASKTSELIDQAASQRVRFPTTAAVTLATGQGASAGQAKQPDFVQAATRGGLELFNVPALAATGSQLAETTVTGSRRIAAGEADQVGADIQDSATRSIEAFERQITQNPVETAALAAGSLVVSSGAIGGASRISKTAGGASKAIIQPGEEIVGIAGGRATRAIAGDKAADKLFPNNEPVIFSEEAAIRTGIQAQRKVSESFSNIRQSNTLGAGFGSLAKTDIDLETETESDSDSDSDSTFSQRQTQAFQNFQTQQVQLQTRQFDQAQTQAQSTIDLDALESATTETGTQQRQLEQSEPQTTIDLDALQSAETEIEQELELEQELEQEVIVRPELDIDQQLDQQLEQIQSADQLLDQQVDEDIDQQVEFKQQQVEEQLTQQTQQQVEQFAFDQVQLDLEQEFELEQELEQEQEQELEADIPLLQEPEQVDQQLDETFVGVRNVESTLTQRDLTIQ
jgi:hypothetical protein